ncbi:Thymidylate kinase, partial [Rhizoctonia solani]
MLRPWPVAGYLNPLSMSGRSSAARSDSPFLDAYALSKLLWSDSDASSDEVDDILANTSPVTTAAATDECTNNPDETEVDGLIDTFEVGLPERSFCRISLWRDNVVRPDVLDFMNDRRALSPLPTNRKRKPSSLDLKVQPILKVPKLMIDQPICPACNSTFSARSGLLKHGQRHVSRTSPPALIFQPPTMVRGAFIVIEGLDRSGKSTQCAQMVSRIEGEGKPVKAIKFPDRTTEIGKLIDAYLQSKAEVDDHTIHLLFSANRWELASSIKSLLESGTTIVCDRYAYSGLAFSAAKQKPDLSYEWCLSPDVGLPAPDAAFFLEVAPEVAKQRGGYGQERYENEEMQRAVRQTFQRIGKDVQERWQVVDANRTQGDVEEDLWNRIGPLIKGQLQEDLGTMWPNRISSA